MLDLIKKLNCIHMKVFGALVGNVEAQASVTQLERENEVKPQKPVFMNCDTFEKVSTLWRKINQSRDELKCNYKSFPSKRKFKFRTRHCILIAEQVLTMRSIKTSQNKNAFRGKTRTESNIN
jgi:hypothetical protein